MVGVWAMALLRLKVFYGARSKAFLGMLCMGLVLIIIKGTGDSLGCYIGWVEIKNAPFNMQLEQSGFWQLLLALQAVAHTLEAVFSWCTSILFLKSIGKGVGLTGKKLWFEIFFQHEGFRLVAIALLNLIIAGFAIYGTVLPHTYVTRAGLFLPSWTYALEFYTFLQTSYVSARTIITNSINVNTGSDMKHSQMSLP